MEVRSSLFRQAQGVFQFRLLGSTFAITSCRPRLLVGNMFDIPQSDEWKTYTEFGRQFGAFNFP